MLPITNRERETIVFHKTNGETNEDISRWIRVSVSTITRIWTLYKTTGNILPKPQNSGRKPLVTEETMNKISDKIKEESDTTLLEIIDQFQLPISESALCKRLIKLGLTYKKRHSFPIHNCERM